MEVFRTDDFYIFTKGSHSLWWDRQTGAFIPKTDWDLTDADDPQCLGTCQGIIGKVEHPCVFDPRLLLIKESLPVGKIHGNHQVYKIKSVAFLSLGPDSVEINLPQCSKHKTIAMTKKQSNNVLFDIQKNTAFTKTWGTLKSAGNTIKNTTQHAAAIATGTPKKRDVKDKEKFERQIIEEFYKIFTETNSFYYCLTSDITNSLQRLCNLEKEGLIDPDALWKTVDDKFFWNKYMLQDLIELNNPLCNPWILPIIQGYIQIEDCKVEVGNDVQGVKTSPKYEIFTLCILSRRSRFRAGTRYKRRGVDENGECANYVETEQIVTYKHHEVSFVQVRGSVPVYWSQPGYKYRPPPRIDKGEAETKEAFEKHFTNEVRKYGPVCVINLVDQSGKERIIWDTYTNYIFQYNSPYLTYVTFDFHEYCRGMHFENVSILINSIADIIKEMNYCWRDKQGHICSQTGVFRVNCIDCLDRTNVVQTALGKAVMEIQFCKLGLISPESTMPASIRSTFQLLWANNGDIISKQYAGTNALKGDYTRTGSRKLTGIMKDGMNSANRYYKNHFKDSVRQCCLDIMHGRVLDELELQDFTTSLRTVGFIASELVPFEPPSYIPNNALATEFELANALYHMTRYYLSRFKDSTRQGTIDLMLGNYVSEDLFSEAKAQQYEEDCETNAEHVKLLIEDCKKMLINDPEYVLGSWGVINADPSLGDPNETEMDTVLILTKDSYFVADYDDQVDKVTKYQKVHLKDLTLIECGWPETLFKLSKNHFSIRLNYKVNGIAGYYHMFRSTNLRFFNNMAVVIKSEEEEIESLKSICEAFIVAIELCGLPPISFTQGNKLERRKSKIVNNGETNSNIYLDIVGLPNLTRNVSETQLIALKSAGTKAFSNVTQQFSKLNKLSFNKQNKSKGNAKFSIGFGNKNDTSSDSDEDYENSIFQPNVSAAESAAYNTDSSTNSNKDKSFVEQGVEVTEDTVIANKTDHFLPSVGIVMGSTNDSTIEGGNLSTLEHKANMLSVSSEVNNVQLSSIMQNVTLKSSSGSLNVNPEIQINSEGYDLVKNKVQPPNTLKLDRKHSHSSGEVDVSDLKSELDVGSVFYGHHEKRSNSEHDITINISQSQSESALKNRLTNLTSPVTNVLSPLSKLAKGVQNLGANFDPRKLSMGGVRNVTEREIEEHQKLQEKFQGCKTRLIAL